MKIKRGDWVIDTKSLFRVEWRRFYPIFVIHEKFQNKIKWISRTFTVVGISISIVTMPWFLSLSTSLILVAIDYLLENVIFLYTTIILQEPPKFEIKNGVWISNFFLFPKYKDDLPMYCMGLTDKQYAEKLFEYFLSWNNNNHIDIKNLITVNWTMCKDKSYITEIYANPRRENLDVMFNSMEKESRFEKFGKRQQQFIAQMTFGLKIETSEMVNRFISFVKPGENFYFAPAIISTSGEEIIEILYKLAILKNTYNIKN